MYIKSFSLENFRVFKELQTFELAPISILTGTNSSGKSGLFKALLLLNKNLKDGEWDHLSFSDSTHKLGTFNNSLNHDNDQDSMSFGIKMDLGVKRFKDQGTNDPLFIFKEHEITCLFSFKPKEKEHGKLSRLFILAGNDIILEIATSITDSSSSTDTYQLLEINIPWFIENVQSQIEKVYKKIETFKFYNEKIKSGKVRKGEIKKEHFEIGEGFLFQSLWGSFYKRNDKSYGLMRLEKSIFDEDKINEIFKDDKYDEEFIKNIKTEILKGLSTFIANPENYVSYYFNERILNSCQDLINEYFTTFDDDYFDEHDPKTKLYGKKEQKLESVNPFFSNGVVKNDDYAKNIKTFDLLKPEFSIFIEFIKKSIQEIMDSIEKMEITFLESIRALSQRLYLDTENKSFNRMLIYIRNNPLSDGKKEFINKWLKEFKLGDELNIENAEGVATKIFITKNGKRKAIADLGYGVTQLLPILLQTVIQHEETYEVEDNIGYNPKRKLFLIEEPESNLHPALQSKLADFFVDAMKNFNVHFIIETHSEYLIRKLQYLTLKKEISPSDTSIHYLYDPTNIPEGQNQVIKLNILEDGRLDKEFGRGFFDEASTLMLSLLTGESLN